MFGAVGHRLAVEPLPVMRCDEWCVARPPVV